MLNVLCALAAFFLPTDQNFEVALTITVKDLGAGADVIDIAQYDLTVLVADDVPSALRVGDDGTLMVTVTLVAEDQVRILLDATGRLGDDLTDNPSLQLLLGQTGTVEIGTNLPGGDPDFDVGTQIMATVQVASGSAGR